MKVFVVDYDIDYCKGYKVVKAESVEDAYGQMLEYLAKQAPSKTVKFVILGNHGEPFEVMNLENQSN